MPNISVLYLECFCLRSEVLAAVLQKFQVFWDVMLCHSVNTSTDFVEACEYFHIQGLAVQEEWAVWPCR
jgi:hypothetical protein